MSLPAAIAFDLYGTLVDYGSLSGLVESLSGAPPEFVTAWRQKQLQYAMLATLMERYLDFDQVTGRALDFTAAQFRIGLSPDARATLVDAWSHLPAHPDVPDALEQMRARGIRLAVLSNGTPQALERTVVAAGLGEVFDVLLSVDAVRAFKPHPKVYHLAVAHFGLPAGEIGFVSSNGWDATGAAEFGLRVFWCNRSGAPPETLGAPPEFIIDELGALFGF